MTVLFRATMGFLIAFAVHDPRAVTARFETPAIAALKADLADAERCEAARARTPFDAAIVQAAGVLRATARVRDSRF
ncbi:MAG: hypothetical protein ABSC92_00585 [Rhizomicrobium sp.]|jgi:hypothetical protein